MRKGVSGIGLVGSVALLLIGILQLCMGYVGLQAMWGPWAAILGLVAALLLRFTLPMTAGTAIYAAYGWGWSWPAAIAFAAPGLVLAVPGMMLGLIARVRQG